MANIGGRLCVGLREVGWSMEEMERGNECVDDGEEMMAAGFSRVVAVTPKNMDLSEAMRKDVAKRNISIACGKIYNENQKKK